MHTSSRNTGGRGPRITTSIGSGTRYGGRSSFVRKPKTGSRQEGDRPRRHGGGGSGFGRGGRRGGGRQKTAFIDEKLFINKAPALSETVESYAPEHTFADFKVHERLAHNLLAKGFIHPSPIQDKAIPVALTGTDIIGIASTGTGKTAAFLIPIINKLVDDRWHLALVLTPTRELAQQVEEEFKSFTHGMRFYSACAVGGLPINRQINQIRRGVQVVIGTPGRVKDLMARGVLRMADFRTVVLDEADRMLDMGFIDDMRQILGEMPKPRHGMFFSATFSNEIKALCGDFLHEPVTIALKTRDTSASVDQDIVRVPYGSDKFAILCELLHKPEVKKVLIFRETKRNADTLARDLRNKGFAVRALHGDMRSRERMRTIEAFSDGTASIVVATDVAARGIDIPDITHVINYDVPSTYDTYIHRIGRTGRGNKKGVALTFVK